MSSREQARIVGNWISYHLNVFVLYHLILTMLRRQAFMPEHYFWHGIEVNSSLIRG